MGLTIFRQPLIVRTNRERSQIPRRRFRAYFIPAVAAYQEALTVARCGLQDENSDGLPTEYEAVEGGQVNGYEGANGIEQDQDQEMANVEAPQPIKETAAAGAGMAGERQPNKVRVTRPYLTKYERARVLGTRALQIRCVVNQSVSADRAMLMMLLSCFLRRTSV